MNCVAAKVKYNGDQLAEALFIIEGEIQLSISDIILFDAPEHDIKQLCIVDHISINRDTVQTTVIATAVYKDDV